MGGWVLSVSRRWVFARSAKELARTHLRRLGEVEPVVTPHLANERLGCMLSFVARRKRRLHRVVFDRILRKIWPLTIGACGFDLRLESKQLRSRQGADCLCATTKLWIGRPTRCLSLVDSKVIRSGSRLSTDRLERRTILLTQGPQLGRRGCIVLCPRLTCCLKDLPQGIIGRHVAPTGGQVASSPGSHTVHDESAPECGCLGRFTARHHDTVPASPTSCLPCLP